MSSRINARLSEPLAEHVSRVVGAKGFFETPSEYIRDLIRRDMQSETYKVYQEIIEGWKDIAEGRYFESSGDFKADMNTLKAKRDSGWR